MNVLSSDLVGQPAVTADGVHVGKIREVVGVTSSPRAYLVITYSLFYDAIVPADEVLKSARSVRIPLLRSSLFIALREASGHLSAAAQRRIEEYYGYGLPKGA